MPAPNCDGTKKGKLVKSKDYENRQADYSDRYRMEYRRGENFWRIYCTRHPDNPNSDHSEHTHLYVCCGEVCVNKGKEPRSLEVAEAIAFYFMAGYSEYVRTGVFPDKGGTVAVPD